MLDFCSAVRSMQVDSSHCNEMDRYKSLVQNMHTFAELTAGHSLLTYYLVHLSVAAASKLD